MATLVELFFVLSLMVFFHLYRFKESIWKLKKYHTLLKMDRSMSSIESFYPFLEFANKHPDVNIKNAQLKEGIRNKFELEKKPTLITAITQWIYSPCTLYVSISFYKGCTMVSISSKNISKSFFDIRYHRQYECFFNAIVFHLKESGKSFEEVPSS